MKIFISHISAEKPIALILKEWLESTFSAGNCKVFVSSDSDDIPPGSKWFDEIEKALEITQIMIILCSSYSISRPWINFEAGCSWIKQIPIIPICHSGISKSTLPEPLRRFQALDLANSSFSKNLTAAISKHFGLEKIPKIDFKLMNKEIIDSINKIEKTKFKKNEYKINDLDEIEISILRLLFLENKEIFLSIFKAKYSETFSQIENSEFEFWINELVNKKYATKHYWASWKENKYQISHEGQRFIIELKKK